jgi:hypothetical protein
MIPFPHILLAGCLALRAASGLITAGDLAAEFPGLETVPPDTALALAPWPGVARVMRIAELDKIAERLRVEPPRREICVQEQVAPPDPGRMLAAMQAVLPEARIAILDFSHRPIPEGNLEFSRGGLREGPAGCFWSGNVRYATNRLFPIWARVVVSAKLPRVIATADLEPGRDITLDLVREETHDVFPLAAFPQSAAQIVGQSARVFIRAGSVIRADQLEAAKQVRAGETRARGRLERSSASENGCAGGSLRRSRPNDSRAESRIAEAFPGACRRKRDRLRRHLPGRAE